jgi:hypothetical protein
MNVQVLIVMAMVVSAALYFGRGFVLALLGKGGCASGGSCGSCKSGGCSSVARFEAIRKAIEERGSV